MGTYIKCRKSAPRCRFSPRIGDLVSSFFFWLPRRGPGCTELSPSPKPSDPVLCEVYNSFLSIEFPTPCTRLCRVAKLTRRRELQDFPPPLTPCPCFFLFVIFLFLLPWREARPRVAFVGFRPAVALPSSERFSRHFFLLSYLRRPSSMREISFYERSGLRAPKSRMVSRGD